MEASLLSFSIKNSSVIQIYCNDDGLDKLIDVLSKLRAARHIHLRAPPGGNVLSAKNPFNEPATQEVIITHVGD